MLPIEDLPEDVMGKAITGLNLTLSEIAKKAHLPEKSVRAVLEGQLDEDTLRKLAPVLELSPGALVELSRKVWQPERIEVPGLKQITTPFGEDMQVNAYVVYDFNTSQAVVFDTGTDATPILDFLKQKNLSVVSILLTHTHADHIADLERLARETGAEAYTPRGEPLDGSTPFDPGKTFMAGSLEIRSVLTSGHSPAGTTFVIHGLNRPVAIVGDALFCCSIGGPKISYEDALSLVRKHILTLPDGTILCPGHGPMTTVAEEKRHNPFFPEFKS